MSNVASLDEARRKRAMAAARDAMNEAAVAEMPYLPTLSDAEWRRINADAQAWLIERAKQLDW